MSRPLVFLSNFHPYVTKNTLNSGVLDSLAAQARVIIFVLKNKEDYFKELYEKENVVIEGIDLDKFVTSRRNKIFIRLSEWLLDTNVMRFHKMEAFAKTGNWPKYYFSLIFTKIFANALLFKKIVRWLDYKLNNPKPFQIYFDRYKPDVVFATDAFGDHDVFLLKNAKSAGVKNITMLRSWDNTTSRGYLRFVPDKLIVHNEVMKEEMPKYHDIDDVIISLSGIPQFEKYINMKPTPREEFFKKIGADPNKRLILFTPAGQFFIDSDWHICQILKDLYHEKKIPQDVQFVIRLHPFLPVDLSYFQTDENFIIDTPGPAKSNELNKSKKEGELDMSFFQHIFDSIYHSSLAINTISSIIIDTAIFDKPLITINFDGWERNPPITRSLLKRWRLEENQTSWLSIGSTRLIANKEELALWINNYLNDPSIDREERALFKNRYCWKYDGASAERIASIVLN